jgi:glycine dehydrogenase subunit 1
VSRLLSPRLREAIATFAAAREIEILEHPAVDGRTVWDTDDPRDPAALVFGQPNYLGAIEAYDETVAAAHDRGGLAIAAVDPVTLGVLRTPGDAGCDIVVGEGQPFGSPMSYGGPVLGMLATTLQLVRRIPGRLIGRTRDADGEPAYVMTLRTREQDIRRERASSNICTNQSLNAVAAAVHLAWLGPDGLAATAHHSAQKAHYLAKRLAQLPGVSLANDAPFVREFAVLLPVDPDEAVLRMAEHGILAGIPLSGDYPELPGGMLIAVTEQRTRGELDGYVDALREVVDRG